MSARAGKRPMRSLTAHEKLDAIRRVHDGESKASVARDIGVPESTLRGWCKNEDKISYLSRQSSPETDESLESQSKKPRLDDSMQPFNLSLKNNSGTSFSPNSETRYGTVDTTTKMEEPCKVAPLNLNTKPETPKATTDHFTERERNKVELARMSVELGLNRPEMFLSNLHNGQSLVDLSANINLLAQWNTLLLQQQQQQQKVQHGKTKVTTTADTSSLAATSSVGLLTTVDMEKNKQHLPKEQQSVNESIWYWLKNQQNKLGLNQNPLPNVPHPNGTAIPMTTASTMNPTAALNGLNGVDQSSWFWKWYKQLAYSQQTQQQPQQQYPTAEKQILYQQLTQQKEPPAQKEVVVTSDQHNAENLSVTPEKFPNSNGKTINNTKARSVLDNLLFNNNNNVAVNKKETKEDDETPSQREALEHGEKFLKWLETYSDPSVTAMQIMQFKTLLNKVKTDADRKNADQQNKTKVKRK